MGRYFKYSVTGRSLEELLPYQNPQFQKLTLKRAEGTFVPIDQAEELEAINKFINTHTAEGETIFAYPEFGTYHFLVNRPFMGRFPMPTLSWFCEKWHQELIADLKGSGFNKITFWIHQPQNHIFIAAKGNSVFPTLLIYMAHHKKIPPSFGRGDFY